MTRVLRSRCSAARCHAAQQRVGADEAREDRASQLNAKRLDILSATSERSIVPLRIANWNLDRAKVSATGTAAALPLGLWEAIPRARQSGRHPERPHSRPAAGRSDDSDDAWSSRPDRTQGHRTPLTRARALSAPDAGATRADREPDCDRAISGEAGQEGTRKWHTYRHSAR